MLNTKAISQIFLLTLFSFSFACSQDDEVAPSPSPLDSVFSFINEETDNTIAVYGSKEVNEVAYNRAYNDVKSVLAGMDKGIRQGLLNADAKMLVVTNEEELEENIEFFMTLLPVESVFTNIEGTDETLPTATDVGLSATKLELMYLCVYYSLLTEENLLDKFQELQGAYKQAADLNIFIPGEAYQDGYEDEIHQNASEENALKYGSYLFNLYMIYFGDGTGAPGEFTITTKAQLESQNPLGFNFIKENFDQ